MELKQLKQRATLSYSDCSSQADEVYPSRQASNNHSVLQP